MSPQTARVRGHDGYGFPKWVTELDVSIDSGRTVARVGSDSGGVDLALSAVTPSQARNETGERVLTLTSYTSLGGAGHSTLSQTNVLSAGTARIPRGVELQIVQGGWPMTYGCLSRSRQFSSMSSPKVNLPCICRFRYLCGIEVNVLMVASGTTRCSFK